MSRPLLSLPQALYEGQAPTTCFVKAAMHCVDMVAKAGVWEAYMPDETSIRLQLRIQVVQQAARMPINQAFAAML